MSDEITFEPYEHPPIPVMTAAERCAWDEPMPVIRFPRTGLEEEIFTQARLNEEEREPRKGRSA